MQDIEKFFYQKMIIRTVIETDIIVPNVGMKFNDENAVFEIY